MEVSTNIFYLLDVTIPDTLLCSSKNCGHVVEYGKHFDKEQWNRWTAANSTVTGV